MPKHSISYKKSFSRIFQSTRKRTTALVKRLNYSIKNTLNAIADKFDNGKTTEK